MQETSPKFSCMRFKCSCMIMYDFKNVHVYMCTPIDCRKYVVEQFKLLKLCFCVWARTAPPPSPPPYNISVVQFIGEEKKKGIFDSKADAAALITKFLSGSIKNMCMGIFFLTNARTAMWKAIYESTKQIPLGTRPTNKQKSRMRQKMVSLSKWSHSNVCRSELLHLRD